MTESSLSVAENDVHVWWATAATAPDRVAELESLLTLEERRRAARYLVESARQRFIAHRATVRSLLGRYLGVEPHEVSFEYGDRGKPRIATCFDTDLRFNVAHSQYLVVTAVCRHTEVGVDLEYVDETLDTNAVVSSTFSAKERDTYGRLPTADRRRSFFRTWTRKEAYLKGWGYGLMGTLAVIELSAAGTGRFSVKDKRGRPGWMIEDLTLDDRWVGALATQRWEWPRIVSRWVSSPADEKERAHVRG